jgi:hypothetical protein
MKIARHWQDSATAMIGLLLVCAPWLVDYQGDTIATLNACASGLALATVGVAALYAYRGWLEGAGALLGLWLLAAPLVLGFVNVKLAAWDAALSGGAELLLVVFNLLGKDPRDLPWAKADRP